MYVLEPEGCGSNYPKKSPGYDYTLILESGLGLLFMQKGFSGKDISRRVFLRGRGPKQVLWSKLSHSSQYKLRFIWAQLITVQVFTIVGVFSKEHYFPYIPTMSLWLTIPVYRTDRENNIITVTSTLGTLEQASPLFPTDPIPDPN